MGVVLHIVENLCDCVSLTSYEVFRKDGFVFVPTGSSDNRAHDRLHVFESLRKLSDLGIICRKVLELGHRPLEQERSSGLE